MSNENSSKENLNTPLINDEDLIPVEIKASGVRISFPDFYFYKIRTFCGKYIDIQDASTANNKAAIQYTANNNNNQKFLIFTLDNNYSVIAAKHSGKVLDIMDIPLGPGLPFMLIQYDFQNGDNQKFFIANDGAIAVKKTGHVWDVKSGSTKDDTPIIPYNYSGASNQKFSLENSGTASVKPPELGDLPNSPDFKTNDLNEILPDNTTPVITHATYLPYFMVKDPYYNTQQKMQNSPYYILVRRQYWEKISQRIVGAGESYKYEQTTGVARTDQISMTETTEIAIGADLGFMFKGFSANLSTSITKTLSVTKSTSTTESVSKTETVTDSNPFMYTIARAKYMLINEYYVTRANGQLITSGDATYWKVPNPNQTVTRTIPQP
ncbi:MULTISPECIES: RICIN domain-containing protein [Bacillus]|uniref:RICIN domain-containing protein n=1 Tax=Bacillus TaxID=1386 RepID=UPI0009AAEE16|nr:RICIN domain-containing protein [Bacillus cereus]MCD2338586.1 RICIN domain-containing protein [Bacillus cereus]MCU7393080.1 RICIN domain-containing protein [Bacillus sp. ST24]